MEWFTTAPPTGVAHRDGSALNRPDERHFLDGIANLSVTVRAPRQAIASQRIQTAAAVPRQDATWQRPVARRTGWRAARVPGA